MTNTAQMPILNLEKEYKSRILEIKRRHLHIPELNTPGKEYRKSFILPQEIKMNSILFIGINPSYKQGAENELPELEFYRFLPAGEDDITYFKKFKEVAAYCKEEWSHLDLFYFRERDQKIVENLTVTQPRFLEDQLALTAEIISSVSPKIIVVANSFASQFFGKKRECHRNFRSIWLGHSLDFEKDFDDQIGTYRINISERKVPIIFTGMLSGQRALDIGSLERLKWQIRMILQFVN